MRRSFTAVLEKNATFDDDFATEPYEAAWAGEARWFIRILEIDGAGAHLRARAQISPDGLFWCDQGPVFPDMPESGMYSIALHDFGGWLRLQCELGGQDPRVKVLIYLALKE